MKVILFLIRNFLLHRLIKRNNLLDKQLHIEVHHEILAFCTFISNNKINVHIYRFIIMFESTVNLSWFYIDLEQKSLKNFHSAPPSYMAVLGHSTRKSQLLHSSNFDGHLRIVVNFITGDNGKKKTFIKKNLDRCGRF